MEKEGRVNGINFLKIMHCEALSLTECITLIKQNFRPTQNNYEVYKQAIKDVRKNYYLQLNSPSVKLRISWDKTNNTITIKNK